MSISLPSGPPTSPATLQSLFRLLLPDVPLPSPPLLNTSEAQLLLTLLASSSSTNPHQLAALALAELCHLPRPTLAKVSELDVHLEACFAEVVDDWAREGTDDDRVKAVGFVSKLLDMVPSAAVRILGRPGLLLALFATPQVNCQPSSSSTPYVPPPATLPLALTTLLSHLIGIKDGIALLLQSEVDVPRWLEEQYQNTSGNLKLRARAAGVRVRLGRELLAQVGEEDDDHHHHHHHASGEVGEQAEANGGIEGEHGREDALLEERLRTTTLDDNPSDDLTDPPVYEAVDQATESNDGWEPLSPDTTAALFDSDVSGVGPLDESQPSTEAALPATTSKKKKKKKKKSKSVVKALEPTSGLAEEDTVEPAASTEAVRQNVTAQGDVVPLNRFPHPTPAAASSTANRKPSDVEVKDLAFAAHFVDNLIAEWLLFATQKRAGRTVLSIAQGVAILEKHRALPPNQSKVIGSFLSLSVLSTSEPVKDLLAANVQFLGCLFNLICSCSDKDTQLLVAMCKILFNLVSFRPSVQEGMECPLRERPTARNTVEGEDVGEMEVFWRQDLAVIRRAERLVSASIISILVRVSQQHGSDVAQVIGPTLRALAEIDGAREELRRESGPLAALWMMSQMLPAAPRSGRQDQVLGQLEGALLQTLHGLALMVTGATKEELESTISPVEDLVAPICLLLFTDRDVLPGLLKADALAALKSLTCCGPDVTDEIASFHGYELMRFLERLLVGQDYYLRREANSLVYSLFHAHSPSAFKYLELPFESAPNANSAASASTLQPLATTKAQGKRPVSRPSTGSFSRGWNLLNILLATGSSALNELAVRLCASASLADIITAYPNEACSMLLDHPDDRDRHRDDVLRYLLALFRPHHLASGGKREDRIHAGLVDRGAFILLHTVHALSTTDPDFLQTLKRLDARAALVASMASIKAVRPEALEADLGRPNGEDLRRELLGKLKLVCAVTEGRGLEDIQWRVLGVERGVA